MVKRAEICEFICLLHSLVYTSRWSGIRT